MILTTVLGLFKKKLGSWTSNLPSPIFTQLIIEGYNRDLVVKGNDMELFHYLSDPADTLTSINDDPQKLFQNLSDIKDLILNKKFVPFPPVLNLFTKIP